MNTYIQKQKFPIFKLQKDIEAFFDNHGVPDDHGGCKCVIVTERCLKT